MSFRFTLKKNIVPTESSNGNIFVHKTYPRRTMWVSCVDEKTESLLYYLAKQIYPEEISTFLWYIFIFKKVQKVRPGTVQWPHKSENADFCLSFITQF